MQGCTAAANATFPWQRPLSVLVFHKMADGLCEEGTKTCISDEKPDSISADFVGEIEDGVLDVKPVMSEQDGAFFTHKDGKKCCSKFGGSAVHKVQEEVVCVKEETSPKELAMQLEVLCEESEDNCRKKRCTDRYDSSESSDR